MSFGWVGDSEKTLKSWVPKLRQLLARITTLESDSYSDREVLTNKVFLGKPVYRRVVNFGALPNATDKTVADGIGTDLDRVVSLYGFATNGSTHIPLPYTPGAAGANGVGLLKTSSGVRLRSGVDFSAYEGFVVLEYTRT